MYTQPKFLNEDKIKMVEDSVQIKLHLVFLINMHKKNFLHVPNDI